MTRVKVLVGILLSATLLSLTSSCITKDYTLGNSFIPSDQFISLRTADFDLPVQLRMADSLQTSSSGSISVGSISTNLFGTTRIAAAATLTPSVDSIIWGKNPTVVNTYLSLTLSGAQYMSDDQQYILQNLYIHELTSPLDTTDYYNNSLTDMDYNPVPVSDGAVVYDGTETILIPLKKEFMAKLFQYTMEQLDSTEYMVNHFYGLYLRADDVEEGSEGGRINDFSISDSYVVMTYSYIDDDGNQKEKTLSFDLGQYWTVNRVSSGSSHLVTDDAKTAIYSDGLCGVKPFISAKAIKQMLDKWMQQNNLDKSKILVTRASLEFPFEYTGSGSDYGNYPTNLFPCRRMFSDDTKKIIYYNPNTEIEDNTFNHGDINRSLFYYKPDAGIYIQKLIKGNLNDFNSTYDLWLMPTITYVDSNTGKTYYYVDYNNYYQMVLNGTKSARHPVMHLTYAIIGE